MPTVLRIDGRRFFFYSLEGTEPPHVHIEHAGRLAKYWLDPAELAFSQGFRPHELNEMRAIVIEHRDALRAKWDEHFSRKT